MPNDVMAAGTRELSAIIAGAVAAAEKRIAGKKPPPNAHLFARFVRQFYAGSPPDELAGRTPEALVDMAAAAWEALQNRRAGSPKVNVIDAPGTARTVIHIVNDDMPFLVSSVTCELERMDSGALLIIHPVLAVQRDIDGNLTELRAGADENVGMKKGDTLESLMHIEIGGSSEEEMVERLRDNLKAVLGDVRLAVRD